MPIELKTNPSPEFVGALEKEVLRVMTETDFRLDVLPGDPQLYMDFLNQYEQHVLAQDPEINAFSTGFYAAYARELLRNFRFPMSRLADGTNASRPLHPKSVFFQLSLQYRTAQLCQQ